MTTDFSDRAWLLHRYPYGDSSLIVELFTQQYGRLGLLAKGARRPRSTLAYLEAGRPIWVRWQGQGELPLLVQAEELGAAQPLNPLQNLSLFYVNELLLKLTQRGDPFPDFFAVYESTVMALHSDRGATWYLRRFERRLLENLGWAPDLSQCVECGRPVQNEGAELWFYEVERGVHCPAHPVDCARLPVGEGLLFWMSGSMASVPPVSGQNKLLRRCLEEEIQIHLGSRALESRRLLAAYLHRSQRVMSPNQKEQR
ncbi:MAG: DNA repair protein RecO [Acidithiobacillus sp.]